ncbi:hypothetical protein LXA43DRAFT_143657 [Ganoderma leucocontextum]|nr:hypothetical protein LXA43DRAFT_143657 [Ganoderma leucocontextum]
MIITCLSDRTRARSNTLSFRYPRASHSQRASQPRIPSQPKPRCAGGAVLPPPSLPASPSNVRRASSPVESGGIDSLEQDDEDALVARYDVVGAAAEQVLEYDEDGLDAEDEELDDDMINSEEAFQRFQVKTRVDAIKQFEDNRRAGGRKTQQANVKAWNLFIGTALSKGHVRDTTGTAGGSGVGKRRGNQCRIFKFLCGFRCVLWLCKRHVSPLFLMCFQRLETVAVYP